jgi:hypothetical protein
MSTPFPVSVADEVCALLRGVRDELSRTPGAPACEIDLCGYLLCVEEPGRLRIHATVYDPLFGSRKLVVRCEGPEDPVIDRLLPVEARWENTGEHVVCLGPYRGEVSAVDISDQWRQLVFEFDVSVDPLLLLGPVATLLGILMGAELPPGYAPLMYYGHPAVDSVLWLTL